MKLLLITVIIFLSSCQKEISWESPCDFRIVDKQKYRLENNEEIGYIQLGGTKELGLYEHEYSTYYFLIKDSKEFDSYQIGGTFKVTPDGIKAGCSFVITDKPNYVSGVGYPDGYIRLGTKPDSSYFIMVYEPFAQMYEIGDLFEIKPNN